jgi:hypothetical protein
MVEYLPSKCEALSLNPRTTSTTNKTKPDLRSSVFSLCVSAEGIHFESLGRGGEEEEEKELVVWSQAS